jgi:hypothetical protein
LKFVEIYPGKKTVGRVSHEDLLNLKSIFEGLISSNPETVPKFWIYGQNFGKTWTASTEETDVVKRSRTRE